MAKRYKFSTIPTRDGVWPEDTIEGTHMVSDGSGITVYDGTDVVFVDPSRVYVVTRGAEISEGNSEQPE